MRKLAIAKTVVILVVVLVGLFFIYTTITGITGFLPRVEERVEISSDLLEYSVRQIAELSTLVYNYTDVGFFEEQSAIELFGREIALPGTRMRILARFDGAIRLGIDVSEISVSVDEYEYEVIVVLPQIVVQVHSIDMDSVQILDQRSGVFVNFSLEDYAEVIAQWKREVEDRGVTRELVEQSQQNTEEVLSVLLLSALPEGYTVSFRWQ